MKKSAYLTALMLSTSVFSAEKMEIVKEDGSTNTSASQETASAENANHRRMKNAEDAFIFYNQILTALQAEGYQHEKMDIIQHLFKYGFFTLHKDLKNYELRQDHIDEMRKLAENPENRQQFDAKFTSHLRFLQQSSVIWPKISKFFHQQQTRNTGFFDENIMGRIEQLNAGKEMFVKIQESEEQLKRETIPFHETLDITQNKFERYSSFFAQILTALDAEGYQDEKMEIIQHLSDHGFLGNSPFRSNYLEEMRQCINEQESFDRKLKYIISFLKNSRTINVKILKLANNHQNHDADFFNDQIVHKIKELNAFKEEITSVKKQKSEETQTIQCWFDNVHTFLANARLNNPEQLKVKTEIADLFLLNCSSIPLMQDHYARIILNTKKITFLPNMFHKLIKGFTGFLKRQGDAVKGIISNISKQSHNAQSNSIVNTITQLMEEAHNITQTQSLSTLETKSDNEFNQNFNRLFKLIDGFTYKDNHYTRQFVIETISFFLNLQNNLNQSTFLLNHQFNREKFDQFQTSAPVAAVKTFETKKQETQQAGEQEMPVINFQEYVEFEFLPFVNNIKQIFLTQGLNQTSSDNELTTLLSRWNQTNTWNQDNTAIIFSKIHSQTATDHLTKRPKTNFQDIKSFFENNPNIDLTIVVDDKGNNVLHKAFETGHYDLIKFLLQRAPSLLLSPNKKETYPVERLIALNTMLNIPAHNTYHWQVYIASLRSQEDIKLPMINAYNHDLLTFMRSATPEAIKMDENNPIHTQWFDLLVEHKSFYTKEKFDDNNQKDHVTDIVSRMKNLLEDNPDLVHVANEKGETAIFFARHAQVFFYLLQKGANLFHLDNDGHTLMKQTLDLYLNQSPSRGLTYFIMQRYGLILGSFVNNKNEDSFSDLKDNEKDYIARFFNPGQKKLFMYDSENPYWTMTIDQLYKVAEEGEFDTLGYSKKSQKNEDCDMLTTTNTSAEKG